ncbi:MAG TPA: 50S ribosomal protein L13 [Thermodesulfobacteriota bacterium]|nr:50S ribosomal protein L13 [Thermodesulfobacteriota bacterium]
MKTYLPTPEEIDKKKWFIVDAKGKTLGRIASRVAMILRGKHKPIYTPHLDCGDFVIIINAGNVAVTGKKLTDKIYHRHSGYPGGLKAESLEELLERRPEEVLTRAVEGMLPEGRLGRKMLKKLKVYAGEAHPHKSQNPSPLSNLA